MTGSMMFSGINRIRLGLIIDVKPPLYQKRHSVPYNVSIRHTLPVRADAKLHIDEFKSTSINLLL